MKKLYLSVAFVLAFFFTAEAQLNVNATGNLFGVGTGLPDSLRPYSTDKGARTVHYAGDLDGDSKIEFIGTDYTNGGRVHVWELSASNTLELVWSSARRSGISSGSTPRWVRTGDLDGDGNKEIIFPLTSGTADFEIHVYEYQGLGDNNYGTEPAFILPANYFAAQGVGNFRTNREVGTVADFDGDGLDELIMSNRDHGVYILGVFGSFPGFASWQLEGGDPAVVTANSKVFSVSHWESQLADVAGNDKPIIVNMHWNFMGFWGIKPRGTDSYSYPDTGVVGFYSEVTRGTLGDHVGYMGFTVADVDGDGSDEIGAVLYGGDSLTYGLGLLNFSAQDTGLYIFDPSKFGVISPNGWTAGGATAGSFWGIGSGDFNGNGKTEILLGGTNEYNIVAVEYNGSGSLLDPANYTNTVYYDGQKPRIWAFVDIYDSVGTIVDTVFTESPFISKFTKAFDSDGDGALEIAAAYQSIYDSTTIRNYIWNAGTSTYDLTTTTKVNNERKINLIHFEATSTGLELKELDFISPDDYVLAQNFPNPFNPSTMLRFSLPVDKQISLKIYDMLGNEVKTLINNEFLAKGSYEMNWDGTSNAGAKVASGNYVAELQFGNFSKTIKMQMLK
ncbi:MAG: FG-GAP-like repeat-containing protein [Ignavibacteriaceae bacterium]|nr:FG-GAP-like repeat-containing protein [Ignavibacteriaceae bacterium]